MQLADGHDALVHIRLCVRVRLVKHTFVALAGGTGLVGINTGNDHDLVADLFRQPAQAGDVFQYRLAVVSRAGADDQNKLVRLSFKHSLDLCVPCVLDHRHALSQRKFLLHLQRNRKLTVEIHVHIHDPFHYAGRKTKNPHVIADSQHNDCGLSVMLVLTIFTRQSSQKADSPWQNKSKSTSLPRRSLLPFLLWQFYLFSPSMSTRKQALTTKKHERYSGCFLPEIAYPLDCPHALYYIIL